MSTPREIRARSDTTPALGWRPARIGTDLPPDLLQQSARRLGIACLVWTGLWTLGFVLNNFIAPVASPDKPLDDAWPMPGNPAAIAVIIISLGVFAYTRSPRLDGRRALDIGLWHEVAVALAIGIVNQWTPNTTGLSWICVLVVTYPFIVPNTTGKTLLAALAAASMDLVGLAITAARGVDMPDTAVIVWTYLPNYICALLALVPSRVIRRLGQQVTRARRLGSYQLGERIGRGGMGEVYRATHRLLARPAAVKLIRTEVLGSSSPEAARTLEERFRREANAAALLCSPNTIDLYDFGIADDGTLFYVMELLDGIELQTLVQRYGPQPPARVVHLLLQICNSLAEAHARGLVHRDIKPSNILTCRVGLEVDFIKVLDFGLVRPEEPHADTRLTTPGLTAGTPAFMAPEAGLGNAVDRRADLYSLGCVAYWLLTGRLVFEAKTPVEMVARHVDDAPEPPSRFSELEIPPELDAIVLRCLAKKPHERPRDAVELASHLSACAFDPPWTAERAQHWWEVHMPQSTHETSETISQEMTTLVRRSLQT